MKKKICVSCGKRLHHDEWWGRCDYGLIHADCFDEEQRDNPDYECVEYVAKHHPKRRIHKLIKKLTNTKAKRFARKGITTKMIVNNLLFINNLYMSEASKAIDTGDLQEARERISAGRVAIQRYSDMLIKMWKEVGE